MMDKKHKVCIISCYIGQLPDYFKVFLISCRYNKDFNWLIITNDETEYDLPDNVRIINMQLDDVRNLISNKIGEWAILDSAYKLCDYKVAYGLIFEDFLREYTHWGYGDIDVVYGNLSKFITDEMLEKYDKIYPLGHLSILKNTSQCLRAFMIEARDTHSFKEVYTSNHSFYFDENKGINEKMLSAGMKVYLKVDFIDASSIYSRLRNVDANEVSILLPDCMLKNEEYPQNYKHQAYIWDGGSIKRTAEDNGKIKIDEFAYIHFRRKLDIEIQPDVSRFVIGKNAVQKSDSNDYKAIIKDSNSGSGRDLLDYNLFMISRNVPRVKYIIVSGIQAFFYNIKPIRITVQKMKRVLWRKNNG